MAEIGKALEFEHYTDLGMHERLSRNIRAAESAVASLAACECLAEPRRAQMRRTWGELSRLQSDLDDELLEQFDPPRGSDIEGDLLHVYYPHDGGRE